MKRAITLAILSFAATAIAVQRRASPTETPRNTPGATVTFNQDVARFFMAIARRVTTSAAQAHFL